MADGSRGTQRQPRGDASAGVLRAKFWQIHCADFELSLASTFQRFAAFLRPRHSKHLLAIPCHQPYVALRAPHPHRRSKPAPAGRQRSRSAASTASGPRPRSGTAPWPAQWRVASCLVYPAVCSAETVTKAVRLHSAVTCASSSAAISCTAAADSGEELAEPTTNSWASQGAGQ